TGVRPGVRDVGLDRSGVVVTAQQTRLRQRGDEARDRREGARYAGKHTRNRAPEAGTLVFHFHECADGGRLSRGTIRRADGRALWVGNASRYGKVVDEGWPLNRVEWR